MVDQTTPSGPLLARTALAAILSLIAFVFIFGMPWNDLGLWRQTEVPTAIIHFGAAFVALILGVLVFQKDEETIGLFRHPAVLAIFAIALFTAAVAPFSDSPWRSIHGTLKHGIGALWHFELALFVIASALVLRSRASLFFEGALVVSTAAVIVLHALPEELVGWPMSFPEWVGLLAAAVSFVVVSRRWQLVSVRSAVALALFVGGIYVSENRAAMLAAAAALVIVCACRAPRFSSLFSSSKRRFAFLVGAGLAGVIVMSAVAPLVEKVAEHTPGYSGTEMILSDNPLDRHSLQNGPFGTLWSRSHMVLMVLRDLAANPSDFLTGQGWGSFATVYEHHAREVPGRLFPTSIPTASLTYWDAQQTADFHSHNLPIETLLSGGFVALVLWFVAVGSLAATSRTGLVAATGIMVGALFWFPVNHMTIAIAALVACGVAPVAVSKKAANTASLVVAIPIALVCAVFMTAGAQIMTLAKVEHDERYFPAIEAENDPATCSTISTVMLPEDDVNISLYEVLTQRILRSSNRPKEIYERTTNLLNLTCTLRRYYETSNNIVALVTSLEKRAVLVGIGPASYGPMVNDIVNWGKDVDRLLELAPQRTEHVVPYLSALLQRSKNEKLITAELDRFIAKLPPSDPVTVYVEAIRAKHNGDEQGYREKLKKAVSMGYANVFAITVEKAKELGLR